MAKSRTADITIPYDPQPAQWKFHASPVDETLFGGAAGGGKSFAICADAIFKALKYPGIHIAIFRRTHEELYRSMVLPVMKPWLPKVVAKWNENHHTFTFTNGAVIHMCYCDDREGYDIHRYDGTLFSFIYLDELTQFPEYPYTYAAAKLLRTNIPGLKPQIKAGSNPWDIGLTWVKKRFEIGRHLESEMFEGSDKLTRVFIPASVYDNQELLRNNPNYINQLKSIPDEAQRRAYLNGDWNVQIGQFFTEWSDEAHVIPDWDIPKGWHRWRCVDYGTAAPFCSLWVAKDYRTGLLYVYREAYMPGLVDRDQGLLVNEMSAGEDYRTSYADPSMWSKHGDSGQAPADIYEHHGVPLTKANNDRLVGWSAVRRALASVDTPACPKCGRGWLEEWGNLCRQCGYQGGGIRGPQLRIMDSCKNLIRTLPALPRSRRNPEDVDTKAEDHAADALRYGLVAIMADKTEGPADVEELVSIASVKRKSYAWDDWGSSKKEIARVY